MSENAALVVPEPAEVTPLPDVSHLMELALSQPGGAGVEALERLVALQERTLDRQAEANLAHALARFQADCPQIRKTRTVDYAAKGGGRVKYNFASLDVIASTIRDPLQANGLSYTWDSKATGETVTVVCHLRHIDGASRSATVTFPITGSTKMNPAQRYGSTMTYAQRYSLVQVLGLTTTSDDVDGRGDAGSETLNEEQLATLTEFYEDERLNDKSRGAMLKILGVQRLADLQDSQYGTALRMLQAKVGR